MKALITMIGDAYRRHTFVAAYVVLVLSGAAVGAVAVGLFIPQTFVHAPTEPLATSTARATQQVFASSTPTRLVIPDLNLDVEFEAPLALNEDGTVGVPKAYTTVGWYNGSPTPGELGPSVILGHVDSYKGAAVFYNLGKLVPGDTFSVVREDGSEPLFVVEKVERYKQSEFPTLLVYGPIDHPGIRLITCSGTFNKGAQRYSHNLVVYGRLVEVGTDTSSSTPAS
jgi:sortase (surface protein transpeptidase)